MQNRKSEVSEERKTKSEESKTLSEEFDAKENKHRECVLFFGKRTTPTDYYIEIDTN